ncbi:MAG: YIP1 family protein [Deltaproteobacteria bacterium]|nr:YIP1 family protein [Deltaproteobacteria bacterium]
MSSDIPGIPPPPTPPLPPPPPPPYGGARQDGLPWERRTELGFFNAFLETIKLFITNPADAWQRTKEKGDYAEPLIFAILVSWIGIAVSSVWSGLFGQAWTAFLPPEMKEKLGSAVATNAGMLLIQVGLAPIFVLLGLFIGAGIYHVSFMVVGATKDSTSGFEGTFRAVSYASVSQLANVIPFVGGLAALVWNLILLVMGTVRMHRTTQGKAIAGVLIPLLLCCVCIAVVVGLVVGGLVAAFGKS